jgi:DnaJ domain
VPLLLELCKEAASIGPASCITGIPSSLSRSMSGDAQVELCRGEEGSDIVSCVQALSTSKALSDTDKIAVCKGGESSLPAQCVTSMPAWVPTAAKLELCRAATSTGPAECARALSSGSASANSAAAEAVVAVCSGAQSEGPAVCYNHVVKGSSSKLSSIARADLCRGATSEAPAVCVAAVKDTRMSTADKAELCLAALDSAAAVCVNAAPARLSVAQKIQLCSSSSSSSSSSSATDQWPTAPVQCFNSAANSLSEQQRVELCAGAHSTGPAACIKAAGYSLDSRDERVALCSGASSAAPALCVRALKTRADAATVLALCRGAVSTASAHCFDAAPQQLALPLKLRLCAGAVAASVADCMAAAQPRSRQAMSASMAQCPMARSTGAAAAAKRILSSEVAVELCRSSDEAISSSSSSGDSSAAHSQAAAVEEDVTAPVVCAQMAPHGFEDSDLLHLCRRTTAAEEEAAATAAADDATAADSTSTTAAAASSDSTPGGGGAAAAQCASDAPHSFSPAHRAQLCRGASSSTPAACAAVAAAAQHSVSTALIVAACSGAASSNPAHCLAAAAAAGGSSGVTPAAAQACRAAQPEPASIAIKQLTFAGEVLYTNEPVRALLEVHDQWGRAMTWLTGTYVTASLAQQGSNGAVIGGPGRVNTTRSGVAEFAGLTFTQPGNLTLLFSVAGVRLAAVRVRVEETEEAAFVRHCGNVFAHFRCFPADSRYAAGTAGSATEVTASMPWPQGWTALMCADVMRDNGFKVVAGWQKEVWLWYHPGIEALETGHGLPLATMSAWERLGLSETDSTVTASVIKRAYYRESLKWHPDRWVKYSMHAERAQAVFELISDAYKSLSSSSRAAAAAAAAASRSSEPVIVPVAV